MKISAYWLAILTAFKSGTQSFTEKILGINIFSIVSYNSLAI